MNANTGFARSLYPAVAGFAGLGLGIGLLRFAYSPIVPSLIADHWTTVSQAAWLGSANFWGYSLGVVLALPLSRRIERHVLLLFAMFLGLVSLGACAWDGGMQWLASWRFVQGVTGAMIMAVLPGTVMASVPSHHRRIVGGITISGVSFALIPSLLIPWVNDYGPSGEWIMSSLLGLACALVTVPFIVRHVRGTAPKPAAKANLAPAEQRAFRWLLLSYLVAGICLIPDALFLSDYLTKELNTTATVAGSLFSWFALGLGVGAVIGGVIAHRFGSLISILGLTVVGLVGNSVILFSPSAGVVSFGSLFFAIWVGGTVSIASIRTMEIAGAEAHGRYWPMMCFSYSVGMWLASSGFAAMLSHGYSYLVFFWFVEGFALLFLGLIACSYCCQSQRAMSN